MDHRHDDGGPKDPGAQQVVPSFDEKDFEGHRVHTVFVGVHVPVERRHSHRRHKHHHRTSDTSNVPEDDRPSTPPSQRVQFILGEDVDDGTRLSHPLFCEMVELFGEAEEVEWRETARWIKFEEVVEEGGNRWSKPHVATLSLHSLFELRSLLQNGTVILDMEAENLEQITDLVMDSMTNSGSLTKDNREQFRSTVLRKHRHQHQFKDHVMLPIIRSFAEIGRNHSTSKSGCVSSLLCSSPRRKRADSMEPDGREKQKSKTTRNGSYISVPAACEYSSHVGATTTTWFAFGPSGKVEESSFGVSHGKSPEFGKLLTVPGQGGEKQQPLTKSSSNACMHRNYSMGDLNHINGDLPQHNLNFMRKIPQGAEASNILVGEVDFLDKTTAAFVRLNSSLTLGDLTEVPVPTRFLFILLSPESRNGGCHEIGRAMATLLSDEVFHEVAYKGRNRTHLIAGIDEFLDAVTVLPPGEWDPAIRIEPPAAIPSQDTRKKPPEKPVQEVDEEEEEAKLREETGLSRTGRLFGGLINDVKRKSPFYFSDFKDALASQCIASWIFLYFACLSPIITFGGLLAEATGKNMAAMESLVSGFVCGIGYGLFSGQPLTILGSTGPVLVFETIVYDFCQQMGWDYLSFRFWIGTWISIILLILVAVDASALVCYITRFTEENFATLIAFIFIYKSVENVYLIGVNYPIHSSTIDDVKCGCIPNNLTVEQYAEVNWMEMNNTQCLKYGEAAYTACKIVENKAVPNVFLMSICLYIGTFLISIVLKEFKTAPFFPSKVRQFISDFAVIIAILLMTLVDCKVEIATPKLEVPHVFKPTLPTRSWIINPFNGNPPYSPFLAFFPALLGTILIFMDQQITTVIINRRENKLKKGCGYHLDLFVLCLLIQICSAMGLPWFVAATVLSINHVNSLKLESECAAPGEKPQFLGVREQRVTHILIFLTIGMSVFLTPMLGHIPMPVLFGVFLYMGVASLKGLQFFDRILIMFMPNKYQPDYMFLRQVPINRVHIFTIIQMACLICLWTIKSFSSTSILFPLMLVVMIGIRKALDFVFTRRELKILDDIMPEVTKRRQPEEANGGEKVGWMTKFSHFCLGAPNGHKGDDTLIKKV